LTLLITAAFLVVLGGLVGSSEFQTLLANAVGLFVATSTMGDLRSLFAIFLGDILVADALHL